MNKCAVKLKHFQVSEKQLTSVWMRGLNVGTRTPHSRLKDHVIKCCWFVNIILLNKREVL